MKKQCFAAAADLALTATTALAHEELQSVTITATRIDIRGIEDNRVTQLVDGVRMPAYCSGGGPTNFTLSSPLSASPSFLMKATASYRLAYHGASAQGYGMAAGPCIRAGRPRSSPPAAPTRIHATIGGCECWNRWPDPRRWHGDRDAGPHHRGRPRGAPARGLGVSSRQRLRAASALRAVAGRAGAARDCRARPCRTTRAARASGGLESSQTLGLIQSQMGSRGTRRWFIGIALAAFLLRALIPEGFMPSNARPLTLEICPEGFPAQLLPHLAHSEHGARHDRAPPRDSGQPAPSGTSLFEHCSFGASPAAAPSPAPSVLAAFVAAASAVQPVPPPLRFRAARHRPQQARAPPALS